MALDIPAILDQLAEANAIELSELKTAIEEKFGVTAAAPMMGMPMGMPGADAGGGEAAEEKTEFNVVLKAPGGKKLEVIKVVRAATGLGLKEAKALVDGAPNAIKESVGKDEAEELKKKLEEAGGEVELT